jgi:hypothetical protein
LKTHQLIFAIRDRSKTKGIAQHVLMILASRADDSGRCYPSQRDIAKVTGYSLRTISRAIQEILETGELQIISPGGSAKGGQRRATEYQIAISNRSHTVTGHTPMTVVRDSPVGNLDHSHTVTSTVVTQSTDRSHRVTPTNHERTNERIRARKSAQGSSENGTADPAIPPALQTPEFLKAWSDFDEYRRNGKAKKAWTTRAKEIALKTCLKLGASGALVAIERSIMSGWTGIFEPNNNQNPKPPRRFDRCDL